MMTSESTKQYFALTGAPSRHDRVENDATRPIVRQSDQQLEASDNVAIARCNVAIGTEGSNWRVFR